MKTLDQEDLERLLGVLGLKDLKSKLKTQGKLSKQDYDEIQETLGKQLGDKYLELEELEPNYIQLLRSKIDQLMIDLAIFYPLIPELDSVTSLLKNASSLSSLIQIYDDLKASRDTLLVKKPIKIKSCLKKLKRVQNARLRDQLATLLNRYYLERGGLLTSYNSDLLETNPIRRLTAISKLLPGSEDPTSSPIPKSSELRSMLESRDTKVWTVNIERCVTLCAHESEAAILVGELILTGQLDAIRQFSDLKPTEVLRLLLEERGSKATIVSKTDFARYISRIIDSKHDLFEVDQDITLEIEEEKLRSHFSGPEFESLIDSFQKDRQGNLILNERQSQQLLSLWNSIDTDRKILTNPFNILKVCMIHPDKNGLFCLKYSLLLALWLNSFLPGIVPLKPMLDAEELLDLLEEQFESIDNIFESFSFKFDTTDLEGDLFIQMPLDELIFNRERLMDILPDFVKELIETVMARSGLLDTSDDKHVVLERKSLETEVIVELSSDEAQLLHELLDKLNIVDDRFSEQFERLRGSSSQYVFRQRKHEELSLLIKQVKVISSNFRNAQFDAMDPVEVLDCLHFVQTVNGNAKIMQFVAQRLADSEKYGDLFCDVLVQSNSVAEAIHRYTVYVDDLLTDSPQASALVLIASEADPQLKEVIMERADTMSAEEILEYLEHRHPYKMEAIFSQSTYSDFDAEALSYPRKSVTKPTYLQY